MQQEVLISGKVAQIDFGNNPMIITLTDGTIIKSTRYIIPGSEIDIICEKRLGELYFKSGFPPIRNIDGQLILGDPIIIPIPIKIIDLISNCS